MRANSGKLIVERGWKRKNPQCSLFKGRGSRVSFRYPFPVFGDCFRSMREVCFGFPCHVFISGPFDLIRDIFSTSVSHDTLYLPFLLLVDYVGRWLREICAMCSIFDERC